MKRLFFFLPSAVLCLLCGCSPTENMRDGNAVSVSFTLEAGGGTRAATALPQDSTVRVVAYRQVQGQAGYPETSRAAECTYKMTASGLVSCAVNPDGTVDASGAVPSDMELAPGVYDFYTISPALRVYHEDANPMVAVKHRTDFAVSVTASQNVVGGANNVSLTPLERRCARLKFITERNGAFSGITKLRIQSMTLEEMSDEPTWATGTQSLDLPGNAYATSIRLGSSDFKVPAGNQDYQQVGEVNCLPRPAKDFRMRVSVLYNNDTTPTILETTVKGTAFTEGSLNTLTINFSINAIEVKSTADWENIGMGDYVGDVIDLNAKANGRANCYVITENGMKNYCFDATARGNGSENYIDEDLSGISYGTLSPLNQATDVRILWQTGGWGAVVSQASLKGGKVILTTGPAVEGNAVIGIFATSAPDAPCLWSWHIWKVNGALPPDVQCEKDKGGYHPGDPAREPYPVEHTQPKVSYNMMGINLGAYNNWVDSPSSIGLLYQWGRKDPFPGAADFNGKEPNIYGSFYNGNTTVVLDGPYNCPSVSCMIGGTEAWAVAHPAVFISKSSYFIHSDWLKVQNKYLWGAPWLPTKIVIWSFNSKQGTKSIYDPCPVGYKVPPADAVCRQSIYPYTVTPKGGVLEIVSTTWFPRQGYRTSENGGLVMDGSGHYWQNSHSYMGQTSGGGIEDKFEGALWSLNAGGGSGPNSTQMISYGFSIRCVKEGLIP